MDFSNIKRTWMITDTHLGIRNNSLEWMEIQKTFFYDFFIPLLKKEKRDGDVLIHLGDVFDSRHSLGLFTLNFSMKLFEDIGKIIPVVIILGNHDIAKKNTNDVNSVKILSWIPNITIFEEPKVVEMSKKKLLFMPWRAGKEEEELCIKENPADFLFCHTDIQGLKFNRQTVIQDGIDFDILESFRKVFSGHIHFSQSKKNFRMLGCPYSLTRSDMNNDKGIWLFDIEDETEKFFENTISPKFIKTTLEQVIELEEQDAIKMFNNNFVDIIIDQKWSLSFPFSTFYEEMEGFRRLEFVPRIVSETLDGEFIEGELSKIDIVEISKSLIQSMSHSDQLKDKLISTIQKLHLSAQRKEED